jgi:hypothetical protein
MGELLVKVIELPTRDVSNSFLARDESHASNTVSRVSALEATDVP